MVKIKPKRRERKGNKKRERKRERERERERDTHIHTYVHDAKMFYTKYNETNRISVPDIYVHEMTDRQTDRQAGRWT